MVTYEQVVLGGVQLYPVSIQMSQTPRTVKQVVGMNLAQTRILGSSSYQRELSIKGVVVAEGVDTVQDKKNQLVALDNVTRYTYVDGVHDGNYYILPGSITFDDAGDEHFAISRYTMTLIEE